MRWRYLVGFVALIAVVVWGCSGCADRERVNCQRAGSKAVTMTSDIQIGTGRCA